MTGPSTIPIPFSFLPRSYLSSQHVRHEARGQGPVAGPLAKGRGFAHHRIDMGVVVLDAAPVHISKWDVIASCGTYGLTTLQPDDNLVSTTSRPVVVTPRRERPLIVYAYSESETARSNLEFFSRKGIHGAAYFIFIFSGETNATSLVPELPNIRIVKRPDTCHDLGAIGEVLKEGNLWKKYSMFITMSASVRGPFLPDWNAGCWTDMFLDRLTDTVKVRVLRLPTVCNGILTIPSASGHEHRLSSKTTHPVETLCHRSSRHVQPPRPDTRRIRRDGR